jgi:glycosyltransferase involved in cell wall biosynthesis
VRPKRNAWSDANGLADKFVYLYSGTLGLKHNPALLLELARRYRHDDAVRIVVVSEGLGADWLRAQTATDPLPHLIQMNFQPFATLADMVGTADVLVGVLEEAAAVFSVPSKVLTYLCAERPILLAAPAVNLATRTVARQHAGITCEPTDTAAFLEAADRLYRDPVLRAALGREGRAYAERTFRIEEIVDRFETLLGVAAGGNEGAPHSTSPAHEEEAARQGLLRVRVDRAATSTRP